MNEPDQYFLVTDGGTKRLQEQAQQLAGEHAGCWIR